MKDRNNDMRMGCTICECKEYVSEESVKCAFCGHFPVLHQIQNDVRTIPITVPVSSSSSIRNISTGISSSSNSSINSSSNSSSNTSSNTSSEKNQEGIVNVPSDSSYQSENSGERDIADDLFAAATEAQNETITQSNDQCSMGELTQTAAEYSDDESVEITGSKVRETVFESRLKAFLRKLYSKEDGKEYVIKIKSSGEFQVHCQVCDTIVDLGQRHRGWSNIENHTQTPRHQLNLTLVSDLVSLDAKIQKLISAYPNTFVLPVVNGKKSLKCSLCNKTFKTESKLLFSNVMQHLDGNEHTKQKRKRPNANKIDKITSFFKKKSPQTHEPVGL